MDRTVKQTVDVFDSDLSLLFGEKYRELIVFGSNSLNDYTPGKSDIDFCAVLSDDLSEKEVLEIVKLHDGYKNGNSKYLENTLEGYYYPEKGLRDIQIKICGYKISSERRNWRRIDKFMSNCFELIQFSTNGTRIRSSKTDIYFPNNVEILNSMLVGCNNYKGWIGDSEVPAFLIVQYVARCIFYIVNKRIGSKAEACNLFYNMYPEHEYFKISGIMKKPYDKSDINGEYPDNIRYAEKAIEIFEEVLNNINVRDLTIAST